MNVNPNHNDDAGRASRLQPAITKVLLILGALQIYNIVAYRQNIIDLSQSVQLIATWWRYLTGLPFFWLHLSLTPLQREILILIIFFGMAANLAWKRDHGETLAYSYWRYLFGAPDPIWHVIECHLPSLRRPITFNTTLVYIILAVTMASVGYFFYDLAVRVILLGDQAILYGFLFLIGSIILPVIVQAYILAIKRLALKLRSKNFIKIARVGIYIVATPVVVVYTPIVAMVSAAFFISIYYSIVFSRLKWLIVLLVADVAARFLIDPLTELIPAIPMPPPLE